MNHFWPEKNESSSFIASRPQKSVLTINSFMIFFSFLTPSKKKIHLFSWKHQFQSKASSAKYFFHRLPWPGGPWTSWFSLIFSTKQCLRTLGYCASYSSKLIAANVNEGTYLEVITKKDLSIL